MRPARRTSRAGHARPRSGSRFDARLPALALGLAIATLAIYAQVGAFPFLRFDDPGYVSDNPFVQQGLTGRTIAWAFTTGHVSNWHPVTWLSHMLDWQLFGGQAGAHHLMSAGLHALSAVLLLFALAWTTGALWRSAFVAAVFALHPLHVESVAWISERKDVLSGLFWMLTLLAYTAWAKRPRPATYAALVVVYAFGLMAKPMLVTLPFVLLLLDVWPLGRWNPFGAPRREDAPATVPFARLALEKLPLLVLAIGSSVVTFMVQRAAGSVAPVSRVGLDDRIANAVVSYGVYVFKTLWPAGLAPFYPWRTPAAWETAAAGAALLAITGLAFHWRARRPYVAVGWLWFLGTLVPVIGIVQVGRQAFADRYTYLPQIGLAIAIAWGVVELARTARARRIVAVAAVLALAACAFLTWRQAGYWRDGFSLFGHTIRVTGENNEAETLIGIEWHYRGDLQKALTHYREALRIEPGYFLTHSNLGLALAQLGRTDEAVPHLREAIRLNTGMADAHRHLGLALAQQGNVQEAERALSTAIRLEPWNAQGHYFMGVLLAQTGRIEEARAAYRAALRAQPGFAQADAALRDLPPASPTE